ncbi:MAG: hypothetical protein JNN32_04515 [Flavobacteriales bacterium]|nr:hypothetical protein [Flavobacteriales bacterium]
MRSTLLALLCFACTAATAQWTTPTVNTRVSGAGSVEAATPMSAPGPDGSTYITWFEGASGYRLMMQRLDADGVALWDAGGIVVSDEPQNSALFRFDFTSDNAGNAIVAFQDERSGSLDVVAYRVAPDGSMLWGDGIELPTPGSSGLAPVIGVLNDDRVVIAWTTDRSPSTVAYRILPATGLPAQEDPEEISSVGNCGRPKVVPNSDGGFWIQYAEQQGSFLNPATMYATRFASDGTPLLNSQVSTRTISGFYFPAPISDGHDGLYIAFNSGNAANASLTDVYLQRLRDDGSTWSETGTAVETGATTNRYANNTAPALIGDDEGLMIAYSRKNTSQSEGAIHVQRFDTAGTALLGANGASVVASSTALPEPFGTVPAIDGACFAYSSGGFNGETIGAVIVAGAGDVYPISVASTPSSIDDAVLLPFQGDQAVVVWQDSRFGGSVLAQPIVVPTTAGITEGDLSDIRLVYGDGPALFFATPTTTPTTFMIHAADGKCISEKNLPPLPAGAVVPIVRDDKATGVLLVSLNGERGRTTWRMVMP